MRRYLRDPPFSRFDTIPECDGHTHTHTQTDTRRRHIPRLARRRAVKTMVEKQYTVLKCILFSTIVLKRYDTRNAPISLH